MPVILFYFGFHRNAQCHPAMVLYLVVAVFQGVSMARFQIQWSIVLAFFCIDSDCESSTSRTTTCSTDTQNLVVNGTISATSFAEAVNCNGGTLNVTWHGRVIIDSTISVSDGSTVNLIGADSGSEVDGGGSIQLFNLDNARLHLVGMKLSNDIAANGGAIAAAASTIILINTTFTCNTAQNDAGPVYLDNSFLIVRDGKTKFAGNSAGLYGGA